MKKNELTAGTEYLSNGRNDWMDSTYDATRVRLIDLEPGSWKWKENELIPSSMTSAMRGYRAEVLDKQTGEVKGRCVVTAKSLRGEWAATFAEVCARRDAKVAAQEAAHARKNAARDKVGILMAKVKSFLGLTSDYETSKLVTDVYKETKVLVNIDFLDAMITELDKQGWKYQP